MRKKIDILFDKQKELSISINSLNDPLIYKRTCIVPNHWTIENIDIYLERSLGISKDLITLDDLQDVMVFYKSIKTSCFSNKKIIDYYWYDVKEFIIEIKANSRVYSFVLIAGYSINEVDLKKIIFNFFPDSKIKVNYYRDSWLSRVVDIKNSF